MRLGHLEITEVPCSSHNLHGSRNASQICKPSTKSGHGRRCLYIGQWLWTKTGSRQNARSQIDCTILPRTEIRWRRTASRSSIRGSVGSHAMGKSISEHISSGGFHNVPSSLQAVAKSEGHSGRISIVLNRASRPRKKTKKIPKKIR